MGRKITIDSATLMNKGLEVIEAHWLFGVDGRHIDVVIHPQSVVHSMGSSSTGRSSPSSALPTCGSRFSTHFVPGPVVRSLPRLDLASVGPLEFEAPDTEAFPCLALAYRALDAARSLPVVLNAANEVAVARFLDERLGFTAIPEVIARTMAGHIPAEVATLAAVRAVDRWAREYSQEIARGLELKV